VLTADRLSPAAKMRSDYAPHVLLDRVSAGGAAGGNAGAVVAVAVSLTLTACA
jgi:hypothetical protein